MSKSIPFAILTVAVSASLAVAQDDKQAATWSVKPGSGVKYEAGDAFSLEIKNRLDVHWTFSNNEDAADINTFNVRRLRTNFSGHVFSKSIHYLLAFDAVDQGAAGDGNIKQGWAEWNFVDQKEARVGLRVGQAKTMYGLEATQTSAGLWFVERSVASRAFADVFTRGAWLNGAYASDASKPALRWSLGAMNTDVAAGLGGSGTGITGLTDRGEESANSDNELSYVFSANFDPLGDFFGGRQTTENLRQGDWRTEDTSLKGTIGFGIALENGRTATAVGAPAAIEDVEGTSININTEWSVAGFNILGEYFMRTDDQQGTVADKEEPSGFNVSAGYLLSKSGDSTIQWGFGLRYATVETDEGTAGSGVDFLTGAQGIGSTLGDVSEISAVINAFYHAHACKTQFEWTLQEVDPDGAGSSSLTNNIFRIAFQIEI